MNIGNYEIQSQPFFSQPESQADQNHCQPFVPEQSGNQTSGFANTSMYTSILEKMIKLCDGNNNQNTTVFSSVSITQEESEIDAQDLEIDIRASEMDKLCLSMSRLTITDMNDTTDMDDIEEGSEDVSMSETF